MKKVYLFALLLIMVSVTALAGKRNDKSIDIIIFMGQSNMAGRGVVSEMHPDDAPMVIDDAAMEFRAYSDPTRLYPVTKIFGKTEDNPDGINDHQKKTGGMVPAFVNACYKKTKRTIIAVSASEGGTRTQQWLPEAERLTDAANRFNKACQWLTDNGYQIHRKIMVWTQGESDGDKNVSYDEYKSNLRKIIDKMKDAGVEHCFLIRIGMYNGKNKSISYKTIIKAQEEFCKENADCTMASRMLSTFREKGMMKDSFHYYQDAYNLVGEDAGKLVGKKIR